jgi:hypothetical protein
MSYIHSFKTISISFYSHSFLGVLCKENTSLTLYDLQNTNGGTAEDMEPTPLERGLILTEPNEYISSFSWHPSEENRLLYSTSTSKIKVRLSVLNNHEFLN